MITIISFHPNITNFGDFETLDQAKQTLEEYEIEGLFCKDGEFLFSAYGNLKSLAVFNNYSLSYNDDNLRLYYEIHEKNHKENFVADTQGIT